MPAIRTAIRDTVINPDGTPIAGQITIAWQAFQSADGYTILGGSFTRPIYAGVVDVALVPNIGSIPSGTAYTATYLIQNGVQYSEYWVVPLTGPVTVSAIRVPQTAQPNISTAQQQLTLGSGLQVPLALAMRKVAANYTMQWYDSLIDADATAGGVTVTLPPAASAYGLMIGVRRINAAGSDVFTANYGSDMIADPNAGLIHGYDLQTQFSATLLRSDGVSTWALLCPNQGQWGTS